MYYNNLLYFCTCYSFKTQRTRGKIQAKFCLYAAEFQASPLLFYYYSLAAAAAADTVVLSSSSSSSAPSSSRPSSSLLHDVKHCQRRSIDFRVRASPQRPPLYTLWSQTITYRHSAHPHQAVHFHQCTAFSLQSLYATDTWRTQAPTASIAMSPCAPGTSHAVCQATRHFQNSEELTTLLRNEQRSEHRKDAEERHGQRIDAENIALL